ncbi:hypothetical protein PI124_g22948 [Phytophthora idaei]|nr:hypothetical protein PI125_g24913 [Phytophthora idaei]KAG3125166.1 hypothetical protein PI126_g22902 [Phytophthora idaei]KAG3231960.1 hypothetical protein PI124_g22948 [Phytophthora idaei]
MVKLLYAIVGAAERVFPVDIDKSLSVDHLKEAIKAKNENVLKNIDAYKLQLFLAKTKEGTWMTENNSAALELVKVVIHPSVQTMINADELKTTWTLTIC